MSVLGYVHHSGRFDQSPHALGQALVGLAERPGVDAIGCTEMTSAARAHAATVALQAAGWDLARHGKHGEEALAYDGRLYRVVHVVERIVSHVRFYSTAGKPRAYFTALFVLLEDLETVETTLVSVGHTPSHAGTRRGFYRNLRAKAHRNGLPGWNRELRKLKREWKPGSVIVSMDLNLDVAQKWVRAYLATCYPSLQLVHDGRYVDTHDTRTIDVVLTDRKPVRWVRHARRKVRGFIRTVRVRDSDHRSIITRLGRALKRRRRHR